MRTATNSCAKISIDGKELQIFEMVGSVADECGPSLPDDIKCLLNLKGITVDPATDEEAEEFLSGKYGAVGVYRFSGWLFGRNKSDTPWPLKLDLEPKKRAGAMFRDVVTRFSAIKNKDIYVLKVTDGKI